MNRFLQIFRYTLLCVWHHVRGNKKAVYDTVYEAVQELGGVYVKLLQFLSLRAELFPNEAKLRFLTFYDQVPIEEIDVLAKLTPYQRQQFTEIETTPFASGTFGQVYRAVLHDDTQVVIKVKRPNLKQKLFVDFFLIKILGKLFELFYYQKFVDVPRLIKEFQETTYKELDYQREINNALLLHQQYQDHETLVIPFTYADLSSDDVIVQEYVAGIPVTDLLRMRESGTDIAQWLATEYQTDMHFITTRFSYDSLWQIFSLEKFYSDPHPGNIKVLPNNQYALIDFGIMEASPENKRDYFMVIKHLYEGAEKFDAKNLSEQFIAIGSQYLYTCLGLYDKVLTEADFSLREKVLERYSEMVENWREEFKQIESQEVENFTKVWLDLFTLGEQFQFQVPKGLFAGLRASALIRSVTEFMDPDFFAMKTVYGQIMTDIDEQKLINKKALENNTVGIEEAVETVTDWFEGLAEVDLGLYQDISRRMAV